MDKHIKVTINKTVNNPDALAPIPYTVTRTIRVSQVDYVTDEPGGPVVYLKATGTEQDFGRRNYENSFIHKIASHTYDQFINELNTP
jgi:hypothetical protein